MKHHKWADIKARLKPETQARIESVSRELAALQAKATAAGLSLEDWFKQLAEREAGLNDPSGKN